MKPLDKRLSILTATVLGLLLAAPAVFSATGANIRGDSYNTAPIATTSHLSSVERNIVNNIVEVGEQISTAIANDGEGQNAQTRMQTQMLEEVQKSAARAQEVAKINDRYSVENLGSNACSQTSLAYQRMAAKSRTAKTSKNTQDRLSNYNLAGEKTYQSTLSFRERVNEETEKGSELLYANNKTLTEEDWSKGESMIKNMTNPNPHPKLPDEIDPNSQAAKTYNTLVTHQSQLLSLPERVLSDIHAGERPEHSADSGDILALWNGMSASPGWPVDKANADGQISPRLFQDLLIESRANNSVWATETVAKTGETGLLRELVLMTALLLDLQNQQLDLMRKSTMMDAKLMADEINNSLSGQVTRILRSTTTRSMSDSTD